MRVEEERKFVAHKAQNLLWTVVLLVLALITTVLLFLGGGVAGDALRKIGLGDNISSVWLIARWPAALLVTLLIYAIVYYAAPDVEERRWRYLSPGAVFGVTAWILASLVFFFYVSNFSSYSATYGAFAAIVILLIWLYLTSSVLLLGAELNEAVDQRRGA
jgi:membrane protein